MKNLKSRLEEKYTLEGLKCFSKIEDKDKIEINKMITEYIIQKDIAIEWAKQLIPEGLGITAIHYKNEFKDIAEKEKFPKEVTDFFGRLNTVLTDDNKKDSRTTQLKPKNFDIKYIKYLPCMCIKKWLEGNGLDETSKKIIKDEYLTRYPYTEKILKKYFDDEDDKIPCNENDNTDMFTNNNTAENVQKYLMNPSKYTQKLLNYLTTKDPNEIAEILIKQPNKKEILKYCNFFTDSKIIGSLILHELDEGNGIKEIQLYLIEPVLGSTDERLYDELRNYLLSDDYEICLDIMYKLKNISKLFADIRMMNLLSEQEKIPNILKIVCKMIPEKEFINNLLKLLQVSNLYNYGIMRRQIMGFLTEMVINSEYNSDIRNMLFQIKKLDEDIVIDILHVMSAKLHESRGEANRYKKILQKQKDEIMTGFITHCSASMSDFEELLMDDEIKRSYYVTFRKRLSDFGIKTVYPIEDWASKKIVLFADVKSDTDSNVNFADNDKVIVTSLGIEYTSAHTSRKTNITVKKDGGAK